MTNFKHMANTPVSRLTLYCDRGNFSDHALTWWDKANTPYMEHVMYI